MRLTDAVAAHLGAMELQGRSPCTIRNSASALRELIGFLRTLGVADIEGLTRDVLLRYRERLSHRLTPKGAPLCLASQSEHLGRIRSFCKWLVWEEWLPKDPMQRIPQPRRTRQLPRAILEPDEIDTLCSMIDASTASGCRDRAIFEVLYSSALRRAEIANLRLDDVDTRQGYVFVRCGKNSKDRVVPLGKSACWWIERYLARARPSWPRAPDTTHLFLNRFGGPMNPNAVWHIVRKYVRRAGFTKHVSPHTFRHTCATHMVRAGAPIRHLQEMLGHASIETTQIYTQLTICDVKAAHSRFHPRERSV